MAEPRSWRRVVRDLGMQSAARLPWPLWWPVVALAGTALAWRPSRPIRQWHANVAVLTGVTPNRWQTFRAVWSWARNLVESLQLGTWSHAQIHRRTFLTPDDEQRLRSLAADPGAVVALPHMGSWDLAGAWACAVGMPVSTVAEQLHRREFEQFLRLRERLGFRVYGHRDPAVVRTLVDESRQGRLVCLLADRDFSRRGVRVQWTTAHGPVEATMPSGPAEVALRSGAVLLAIACHYRGRRMQLVVSDPITVPDDTDHALAVEILTQGVCDFFSAQVAHSPHDWHMLQPIFPGVRAR